MKNITNAAQRNRFFRRLVGQWFPSLLKRQNSDYQKDSEKVLKKLQDIEDMVEIIARQIARQIKSGGGKQHDNTLFNLNAAFFIQLVANLTDTIIIQFYFF